nr:MAG TPA: hypothetical protein [Caudoviricetes sp.]DAZ61810.1 MAG TPA: hypothetical protein [Caudoviricetes sp.]
MLITAWLWHGFETWRKGKAWNRSESQRQGMELTCDVMAQRRNAT